MAAIDPGRVKMNERYPAIDVARLGGREPFAGAGGSLDFDVGDFWSWAASDLASNALRGMLAEFLVAGAIGGPHEADQASHRQHQLAREVGSWGR